MNEFSLESVGDHDKGLRGHGLNSNDLLDDMARWK